MRFIMFVAMLGLVLLSGCSQNQPIGNFPPPEGYASWEEYNQQYNSQAAATPVSTPTPTVTTPSPTTTSTLLPTTTATSVPTTTAATNPITTTAPAPIMFNLEIVINPEGSGTVTPSGASYEQGTQIELLANPADGFVFSHWEGDISGTSPNVSITIDEHKTIIQF